MDLAHFRREYTRHGLDRPDLAADPFVQFQKWFEQAHQAGLLEPNAMSLSTVGADGRPSTRTVLLKSFDEHGLVFYTNYESRKATEISARPDVALLFPWLALERQAIAEGPAERVAAEESAAYFATRPYGSQLGAWVSAQSSVVVTRAELEDKLAELKQKFPEGRVPRPHFGAASALCRASGSSGRAGPTACTTASATAAKIPPAPGSLSASHPDNLDRNHPLTSS